MSILKLPRWHDFGPGKRPRWLVCWLAGCALLSGVAVPASTAEDSVVAVEDGTGRRLSLDLAVLELDGHGEQHLDLDLALAAACGDPVPVTPVSDTVRLNLVSAHERSRISGLGELEAELRVLRWPDGAGVLERHVGDEFGRLLDGASPGSASSPAAMLDVLAISRSVGRVWRRWRSGRVPVAMPLPPTGIARLVVRDVGGTPPLSVRVSPVGDGQDRSIIDAPCDAAGRCLVEGLPAATTRILVRATGVGVVDLDPATGVAVVRLAAATEP